MARKITEREQNAADRADRKVTLTVADKKDDEEGKKSGAEQEFLVKIRSNYRLAADSTAALRANQKEDFEFRDGVGQWDTTSRQERAMEGRPCLTINRIPQFIRQVTNAQRAQNLSVKVNPVDDKADVKVAEVFQGLIRNIETQSDAQVAYSTASEHQVTAGMGYWRILTQYIDETSFLQEIRIKRVQNPFTIYFDPTCTESDFSDARFCFVIEDLPKDEFQRRFGDHAFNSLSYMQSIGDELPEWSPDNAIRIAEYWYVEKEAATLYLIETSDGERDTIFQDEYDIVAKTAKENNQLPPTILAKRSSHRRVVKHALICQTKILEGNDDKTEGRRWPGKFIPIVPVLGDELVLNGKVDFRGMVRDARDPQRLYNYQNTALAETLALAPKTPWIGYAGQFEGLEAKWRLANRKNFAFLEVKPVTVNGNIAPLPQRQNMEPPIQAIVHAIAQADNDLKATMGLFDPSMGTVQNAQQSGKAIIALKEQGELANSNFLDNLSRSIRHTGRILIDLIPKIYDAPRVVRYMGLDEEEAAVIVHAGNQQKAEALAAFYQDQGIKGIYDLQAGRFDVAISSGPSMQTKRQEAAKSLTELVQAFPDMFPLVGDLIVQNLDFPGAHAAAKRLKAMVPPQALQDADEQQSPEAVAAENQALKQQMEQMQMELQEATQAAEGKILMAQTKKLEIEARERIETLKAKVVLVKARGDIDAEYQLAQLEAEIRFMEQARDHAHEVGIESMRNAHDRQYHEREHQAKRDDSLRDQFANRLSQERDHKSKRDDSLRTQFSQRQLKERDHEEKRNAQYRDIGARLATESLKPRPTNPAGGRSAS